MANSFTLTISAVDKATAVVKKINAQIARMTRPYEQVARSVRSLSKELGLQKVAKSISRVAASARRAGEHLAKFTAPLLALVGGGTVAGVVELASSWARLGQALSQSAQTIGISVGELQAWRNAAAAVGVSADTMTGSLKQVGDTFEDALFGRNQSALAMMKQLGIEVHQTADGAIDTTRAMRDLSGAISKIKSPQVQGFVARTFGVEALLPLLRQGPDVIRKYQEELGRLSFLWTPAAIKSANDFAYHIALLHASVGGLRDEIASRLAPVLDPLIQKFTEWVNSNRALIASGIEKFVKGLAEWIDSIDFKKVFDGIDGFIKKIGQVVDAIGGWKTVAIALGVVLLANVLAPVASLALALGSLASTAIPAAVTAFGAFSVGGPIALGLAALLASTVALAAALDKISPNDPKGQTDPTGHPGMRKTARGGGNRWIIDPTLPQEHLGHHWERMGRSGQWVWDREVSGEEIQTRRRMVPGIPATSVPGVTTQALPSADTGWQVSQDVQAARDSDRVRILKDELAAARQAGKSDDVTALINEINNTQGGTAYLKKPAGAGGAAAAQSVNLELTIHGLPAGARATAKSDVGAVPVRVATSQPMAGG